MTAAEPIDWAGVRLPGLDAGTVALVTGGSGAIGGRVAAALLGMGACVGLMARSAERLDEAAAGLDSGDRLAAVAGDVADEGDAAAAVAAVTDRWGRLDVLVHCAAVADHKLRLEDLDPDVVDRVLAVNVRGALLMAKVAAVPMRRQGRGCIVNVASVSGHRAMAGGSVYGASKAALIHLTRVLATELGPDGVRVVSISPGQTPTPLRDVADPPGGGPAPAAGTSGGKAERVPLRRRGELDDYVGPILFLASDLARYVTAVDVPVEGGVMAAR